MQSHKLWWRAITHGPISSSSYFLSSLFIFLIQSFHISFHLFFVLFLAFSLLLWKYIHTGWIFFLLTAKLLFHIYGVLIWRKNACIIHLDFKSFFLILYLGCEVLITKLMLLFPMFNVMMQRLQVVAMKSL